MRASAVKPVVTARVSWSDVGSTMDFEINNKNTFDISPWFAPWYVIAVPFKVVPLRFCPTTFSAAESILSTKFREEFPIEPVSLYAPRSSLSCASKREKVEGREVATVTPGEMFL